MRHTSGRRTRRGAVLTSVAAAVTLIVTAISPAQAAEPETVTDGLITPLSLAVGDDGTVFVSQNFAGMLTEVAPGGAPSVIYTDPAGSEVGAVSADGDDVVFATTGGTGKKPTADLWRLGGSGDPERLANLYRFEKRNNPDAGRTYGILNAGRDCLKKVPAFVRPYRGIVESHPYATALGDGVTYVADAAGNSIVEVADGGGVSAVATLPATKVTLTRAMKRELDLPRCVVGKTYRAEGVPTDVEMGPYGNLYVTSLPGAPGEGLPTGRVYRVDPATGSVENLGGGLVSPTGLAIADNGDAYVAQLFAGSILKIPFGGAPEMFAEVAFPGDVELVDGFVYATGTDLTNDGTTPPAGTVLRWNVTP